MSQDSNDELDTIIINMIDKIKLEDLRLNAEPNFFNECMRTALKSVLEEQNQKQSKGEPSLGLSPSQISMFLALDKKVREKFHKHFLAKFGSWQVLHGDFNELKLENERLRKENEELKLKLKEQCHHEDHEHHEEEPGFECYYKE